MAPSDGRSADSSRSSARPLSERSEEGLPDGWVSCTDPVHGDRQYYFDLLNQSSQWEYPSGPAKAAAKAEQPATASAAASAAPADVVQRIHEEECATFDQVAATPWEMQQQQVKPPPPPPQEQQRQQQQRQQQQRQQQQRQQRSQPIPRDWLQALGSCLGLPPEAERPVSPEGRSAKASRWHGKIHTDGSVAMPSSSSQAAETVTGAVPPHAQTSNPTGTTVEQPESGEVLANAAELSTLRSRMATAEAEAVALRRKLLRTQALCASTLYDTRQRTALRTCFYALRVRRSCARASPAVRPQQQLLEYGAELRAPDLRTPTMTQQQCGGDGGGGGHASSTVTAAGSSIAFVGSWPPTPVQLTADGKVAPLPQRGGNAADDDEVADDTTEDGMDMHALLDSDWEALVAVHGRR
jgi:hypothetical protein